MVADYKDLSLGALPESSSIIVSTQAAPSSALMNACMGGHLDRVKALLAAGADKNVKYQVGVGQEYEGIGVWF